MQMSGTGWNSLHCDLAGKECHFVELDPWVLANITRKNAELCGVASRATFHGGKAEEFLR